MPFARLGNISCMQEVIKYRTDAKTPATARVLAPTPLFCAKVEIDSGRGTGGTAVGCITQKALQPLAVPLRQRRNSSRKNAAANGQICQTWGGVYL
jgi:hypothetical protein